MKQNQNRAWLAAAVVTMALGAMTGTAAAYCSEPSVPSRYSKPDKPDTPSKPYCAAARSCSQWEVDSYNSKLRSYQSELEEYESDVEDYVRKLKSYVDDALEYAKCEVRSLSD